MIVMKPKMPERGYFDEIYNFLCAPPSNIVFRPAPTGFLADFVLSGVKMLRRPFCIK